MATEKGVEFPNGIVYAILLIVFGVLFWALFTYTIPAGHRGVVLTFSQPGETPTGEGLHFKIPIVQSIIVMSVQTQKYSADASAASKDLQIVTATIATNYRIDSGILVNLYRTVGEGYEENIIQPAEQETVKATTARFTAEELITQREKVRVEMRDLLTEKLKQRGIIVEDVSITNFDFSEQFNAAIENKVTAEQNALKAQRDLERIKVEAQQTEAIAIGKKKATIAEAEGQAEAIRLIQEELAKSPLYISYLQTQKWDGKLPLSTSGSIPLIDLTKRESVGTGV